MKKSCCNKLAIHYEGDKVIGLNIRVVKLTDDLIDIGKLKENIVVYITSGYESKIGDCDKKSIIDFCPFCGKNLKYLKSDQYVQEIMGISDNLNFLNTK